MSFPRYEKYKDSGVEWLGKVPEHWELKRLRRVISVPLANGIFKRKEEFGEGTLLINVFDIYQNDFQIKFENLDRVRCGTDEVSSYQVLYGDLFFVRSSLKQEGIAVVAIAGDCVEPVVFECHLIRARLDRKLLDARYGNYLLNSAIYRLELIARSKITTMTTIDQEAILSILLTAPPLSEQQNITAFLDRETAKIDELIAEQQRLIELLKEKRQAVISHAVTKGLNPGVTMKDSGVEWLGEVPEHWKHHLKLKDLAQSTRNSFVNGPFGSDLLTSELTQEGIPVIYIRDLRTTGYTRTSEWHISQEKAKQLNFCNVISGDILVAKVGDPPGLAVLYPVDKPEGIVTQDVIRIRVNEDIVDKCFLIYLLNSDYGHALIDNISVESTRKRISLGEYKQLPMILPPKEEQMKITSFLGLETAKLSILTDEAQRAIELFKERRTALISAAVTGKIDVRGVAA